MPEPEVPSLEPRGLALQSEYVCLSDGHGVIRCMTAQLTQCPERTNRHVGGAMRVSHPPAITGCVYAVQYPALKPIGTKGKPMGLATPALEENPLSSW